VREGGGGENLKRKAGKMNWGRKATYLKEGTYQLEEGGGERDKDPKKVRKVREKSKIKEMRWFLTVKHDSERDGNRVAVKVRREKNSLLGIERKNELKKGQTGTASCRKRKRKGKE
jgi:hypothetical protein